jgi:hypothetical protein
VQGKPAAALCQYLEDMPIHPNHDIKYLADVLVGNVDVEEIGHRTHKYASRAFPLQWQDEPIWPNLEVETLLIRVAWYTTEAFRKRECIPVIAARTYLSTSCNWVPSRISPFDR